MIQASFISRTWRAYLDVLNRRPMATQIVQTSLLMGTGDVIAQRFIPSKEQPEQSFDYTRLARFCTLGAVFVAPTVRVWYITMERLVGPHLAPFRAAVLKVAMDQLGFAPVFSLVFISLLGKMQGNNFVQISEKLRSEYFDVLINGYKLWPAVQMVNFFLVPFLVRPLVVSVVALFWNTYLSWKTNASVKRG